MKIGEYIYIYILYSSVIDKHTASMQMSMHYYIDININNISHSAMTIVEPSLTTNMWFGKPPASNNGTFNKN